MESALSQRHRAGPGRNTSVGRWTPGAIEQTLAEVLLLYISLYHGHDRVEMADSHFCSSLLSTCISTDLTGTGNEVEQNNLPVEM